MQQQLPSKMRGLVIEKFAESVEQEKRPYTMREDLPLPKLQPHQILLKVTTSGYCHTEHMVARGEFKHMMRQDLPLIPSHEPTGIVVALGSDAEKMSEGVAGFSGSPGPGKVRTGDRVGAIAFSNFCGKCDDCKAGNLKFCSDQDFVGVTFNGGFAEYCAVDVRSCVRLPDALSFDAAAPLMCAGATIFTAIKACNLKAGQSLGIVGAGSLGHLGVQFSKAMGYRTVIVDARDPPLEMVSSFGLWTRTRLGAYPSFPICSARDCLMRPMHRSTTARRTRLTKRAWTRRFRHVADLSMRSSSRQTSFRPLHSASISPRSMGSSLSLASRRIRSR